MERGCEQPPQPYVLVVGGLRPGDGTLDLLRAYAQLRRSDPGLDLVVILDQISASADDRVIFDAVAAELGVRPIVVESVPSQQLGDLVTECSVFVITDEGLPWAAMALASDRPVVTWDDPVRRAEFTATVRYARGAAGMAWALADALARGGLAGGPGLAVPVGVDSDHQALVPASGPITGSIAQRE